MKNLTCDGILDVKMLLMFEFDIHENGYRE